ncbi:MAG: DUF4178 domain-containing protein [Fibrobacterota bacterium]
MQTIGLLILILIAVGLIIFFNRSDSEKNDTSVEELILQNLRRGGVFTLAGTGPDFDDQDFVVTRKSRYEEDGFSWYELTCSSGSQQVWLEYEEDDELEIYLCRNRFSAKDADFTLKEVKTAAESGGKITFQDTEYVFDETGRAHYYAAKDSAPEKVQYYDFESESGEILTVEVWGGSDSMEISLSEPIRESQITIFALDNAKEG